jgi:ribosome-binding protein aMBF1 (putative translation factor)
MRAQFITTDGGEELVLLSRRDYDAIRARAGDEEAEDRMTERLVAEARERIASGEDGLVRAGADGRPPRLEESFGQTVRRLRKEQDYSQQELAAMAEITQGYLSDIESGRKSPTPPVFFKIRAALGMDNAEAGPSRSSPHHKRR